MGAISLGSMFGKVNKESINKRESLIPTDIWQVCFPYSKFQKSSSNQGHYSEEDSNIEGHEVRYSQVDFLRPLVESMRNQYDQPRSHNVTDLRKHNFFRLMMMIDIDETLMVQRRQTKLS